MAAPAAQARAGEPLGKQMIEGVNAEGTRSVQTIEAGAIGNDRPIAITNESWYSDELQMQVMSKRTDPRTGDESFRLTNIRRGEPGAYLFQPPPVFRSTNVSSFPRRSALASPGERRGPRLSPFAHKFLLSTPFR